MFQTDPSGNGASWQHVLMAAKDLLKHLQLAVQDSMPGGKTVPYQLLDVQIALLQRVLSDIETQRNKLDAKQDTETAPYEWEHVLGQLCFPSVGGAGIRQFQKQTLLAYADVLRGYLVLLEEARGKQAAPQPSATKQGKVPIM